MWIQVRSMDGKKLVRIDGLSKLTKIEQLREKLVKHFDAPVDRQKLFCRGKMLVDGHTLFDYNIALNEVIQIFVKPAIIINEKENNSAGSQSKSKVQEVDKHVDVAGESHGATLQGGSGIRDSIYKVGDVLDIKDISLGAWFEGDLVKILPSDAANQTTNDKDNKTDEVNGEQSANNKEDETKDSNEDIDSDGFDYHVKFIGDDDNTLTKVTSNELRPRSYRKIRLTDLKVSDRVMVNYNYDELATRGYWYDAVITKVKVAKSCKEVHATIYIGKDLVPIENCKLAFLDEIFIIEVPGTQRNSLVDVVDSHDIPNRQTKPDCDHCKDNPRRKCKHCSCCVCGDKKEPEKQLMCDECNAAYHIYCLKPPLMSVPDDDEWYCPDCKLDRSQVVGAGEKLKESSKKSKMASSQSTSNRDWGKGMACQGRSKVCTIVSSNHFGPIPGVEVGSLWKFRVQVSESGVHRPHVAGIHGRETDGAYSIVLSGGYEDDLDDGYEFTYTGSGGRDLSGNKRTAGQSCDQVLTRMNRALAKNCDASINNKDGAEAKNWKAGKPVRVVRNCKGRKHSKYAPEEGNRYDGIYKVVKYWPEKGKSGYLVWKYLLRRDDPSPAPWTEEGVKRSKMLGLAMQYPDGWEEAKKENSTTKRKAADDDDNDDDDDDDDNNNKSNNNDNDDEGDDDDDDDDEKSRKKGRKVLTVKKRKNTNDDDDDDDSRSDRRKKKMKKNKIKEKEEEDADDDGGAKDDKENVCQPMSYSLDDDVKKSIDDDLLNDKTWNDVLLTVAAGKKNFLEKVESTFTCICCQDVVHQPVTTACSHNFCKDCLTRSFGAGVKTCAICRADLTGMKMNVNANLSHILNLLFPGYGSGR